MTARPPWKLAEPDLRPGRYYTSVCREGVSKVILLSGPYRYHSEALAALPEDRRKAVDYDSWCAFDYFGTLHYESGTPRVAFPREARP